jgi:hypothetical protein
MNKSNRLLKAAFERGYRVNERGEVVSPKGRVRKPQQHLKKCGYCVAIFTVDDREGTSYPLRVHRLLAYQMFGDRVFEPGIEVRHLDGNSLNNTPENIALGTPSQNALDRPPIDRRLHASVAGKAQSPHTDETWAAVRADRAAGMGYKKLRAKYGIGLSTLSFQLSKTAKRRTPF